MGKRSTNIWDVIRENGFWVVLIVIIASSSVGGLYQSCTDGVVKVIRAVKEEPGGDRDEAAELEARGETVRRADGEPATEAR